MNDKKVLLIIPTYNERSNIGVLIQKINALNVLLDVLVVDDNSPDRTAGEVRRLQKQYANVQLIVRDKKRGLGSAYKEGFNYALQKRYDIIIQMDADLSHDPAYLPQMLSLLDRYDVVIGSRYVHRGGISNWPWHRFLLSIMANKVAKMLLHVPINDLTSGFKCIKRKALETIVPNTVTSQGYSFQIELLYRAFLKGLHIVEYPIIFQGRKDEESKMSLSIVVEALWEVLFLSIFMRLMNRASIHNSVSHGKRE